MNTCHLSANLTATEEVKKTAVEASPAPAPKPQKWTNIYPYGTKEGDEEAKVFKALSRSKKFEHRSTAQIVKSSGLTRERVEEIIDKYVNKVKPPLIYPHPTNEDHWGYWERCPEVLNKDTRDISTKDKDARVDKHLKGADGTSDTPAPADKS